MFDPLTRTTLRRSGGTRHGVQALDPGRRPLVSVIVPCYNYGHFLDECVASALDHEDVEVEVIIVDDASPDGSGEVAERIAARHPAVSVVRHATNKRHLATYNDGFAVARGDYLVQLSADDLLPRNSLTRAVALLEAMPGVGLVYGRTVQFTDDVPQATGEATGWLRWPGTDWIEARCRSGYNVIATTEVVWRRSVMDAVGPYRLDLPHSGDLELWMRMATVSDVGFVTGADQGYYRLHGSNMHNAQFGSGTMDGQFVDLYERWRAFDALFAAPPRRAGNWQPFADTVRRRLASEALERAGYAYARGFRQFPVDRFRSFARDLDPGVERTSAARRLARRERVGFWPVPLHPLWAPMAVRDHIRADLRTRRRALVGQ